MAFINSEFAQNFGNNGLFTMDSGQVINSFNLTNCKISTTDRISTLAIDWFVATDDPVFTNMNYMISAVNIKGSSEGYNTAIFISNCEIFDVNQTFHGGIL